MTVAPTPAHLESDDAAWDVFVAGSAGASHLQSSPWAASKRPNGWSAFRVAAAAPDGRVIGAQVLVVRPRLSPWGVGYIARGPVTADGGLDPVLLRVFREALVAAGRRRRLALVRIEPDATEDGPLTRALIGLGLRRTAHIQPDRSRIVDLVPDEEAILAGMHRKCRQSIAKSARLGVRVVAADRARLPELHAVYAEAVGRAGIAPRSARAFDALWDALAPHGMIRAFLAEAEETGEVVAALLLVRCGHRVVDLYGGTTPEGGRRRANYLLKWEAMRTLRAEGVREYDLWGLPRSGIEQFKSGFGGREIDYAGAWELRLSPLGSTLVGAAEALRGRWRAWRYRAVHRPDAPDPAPDGADGEAAGA
ncbi:MAG: lipid II:glycine glycyltransferase FemX [Chloroflexota bacterium]